MSKLNRNKINSSLLLIIFSLLLLTALYGCGDGPDGGKTTSPTTSTASSVSLLVSSQALNSSGTPSVTVTAIVKDSGNNALSGQVVNFTASSGSLAVNNATTDASGQATATLTTGGDKSNRTITLTASVPSTSASGTNTVTVQGTTIDISGPDALGSGALGTYTITLKDSASAGITSQVVTISSSRGNTLNPTTFTTNTSGQFAITMTGLVEGVDTLTATAIGATGTKAVTVSAAKDNFVFTAPTANTEIPISTLAAVTVNYTVGGIPQNGRTVTFHTDRGDFAGPNPTITNASGNATIQLSCTTVGKATISAAVTGGPTAQIEVEFVAPTPATMTLQADPSVISTNIGTSQTQRSTLTATIKDINNNLVKNQKINFSMITDPSVGKLSPSTATTDSSGKASVLYIAGTSPSGTNGVQIRATIETAPAITQTATLTVAGLAIGITIGTGQTISSPNDQTYNKDYSIIVADTGGKGVEGANVAITLTPVAYLKGYWKAVAIPPALEPNKYVQELTLAATHNTSLYADSVLVGFNYCLNEDIQYWNDPLHTAYLLNGSLEAGEDWNGNGKIEPGAAVAALTDNNCTTDKYGSCTIGVRYLKGYAAWTVVRLDVTVKVGGTEGKAGTAFVLGWAKNDYGNPPDGIAPPDSPFGFSTTCMNTD